MKLKINEQDLIKALENMLKPLNTKKVSVPNPSGYGYTYKNVVLSKEEKEANLKYAILTAKAYNLNPMANEIYFVPFANKVDGGRTIASITAYNVYTQALDEANYLPSYEWKNDDDSTKYKDLWIRGTLYKKDTLQKTPYSTPWIHISTYAQFGNNKMGMWDKYASLMLEKCVAVRMARMVGINRGYIAEEMYNAKQYDNASVNSIATKTNNVLEDKKDIKIVDNFNIAKKVGE